MTEENKPYEAILAQAEKELDGLISQRKALEVRIEKLRKTVLSLSELCGRTSKVALKDDREQTGLTALCQKVLTTKAQTPSDIRIGLEAHGINTYEYSNFMASLHSTLKRLVASGRAAEVEGKRGTKAYMKLAEKEGI